MKTISKFLRLAPLAAAFVLASCVANNSDEPTTAETIEIAGSWTDNDSNVTIVITSSTRSTKEYLGSAPKTDYTGTIESFNNQNKTYIFSGKELNYDAWPEINENANTIYERNKWYKSDANTYYVCAEAYNKLSLEDLNADTTSHTFDPDNPTANNCGFGAWTKYTRTP